MVRTTHIRVYKEEDKELYECVKNLCEQKTEKACEIDLPKIVGELIKFEDERKIKIGKLYHDEKLVFAPIRGKYWLNFLFE